ncbi:MAG: ParA family protein [Magnetococcales bacterium]|nr:ParA family protein [Magnetococcales bacterium]
MHAIALYNSKGGVGKSTLTLFFADFLASLQVAGRPLRVLVIDLDAQGSSSTALLGAVVTQQARQASHTIGHLALQLAEGQQPTLEPFLLLRPQSPGGHPPLPTVAVLLPERESIFNFDANPLQSLTLLLRTLKPALARRFDVVLLDLPGGLDERHLLAINALVMSDSVVVPIEPTRLAIHALPETVRMIQYVQGIHGQGAPHFLGLILNRTDRRSRQFRLHVSGMVQHFQKSGTPCFDNFLPNAPELANATDDTLAVQSLRERYGGYYPHVKRVVKELFDRWQAIPTGQPTNP